ncbi:vitamin K epoxide reductase family protein [Patescibacteria group bacterium]|nr:vitamin K epoxide reductase family protein [Patescibacteria group bacterium]
MNKRKVLIWLILIFSLIGIAVSIESTIAHYRPSLSQFCTFNETFNCDLVNTGRFSEIFGIPVAILGFVAYGFLFAATLVYRVRSSDVLLESILGVSVLSFLFSLYLTYIEAFVLQAWCVMCLISQLSILVIMICAFALRFQEMPRPELKSIHE